MGKDIKTYRSLMTTGEINVNWTRLQIFDYWPFSVFPPAPINKPVIPVPAGPNFINPNFMIAFWSKQFDVLVAYNPTGDGHGACAGVPGSHTDNWNDIIAETKLIKNGTVIVGPALPIIFWYTILFDSLEDGRLVCCEGYNVFLESSKGSGVFNVAATIQYQLDPSFLKINPSKNKIAIGIYENGKLIVFDVSILSVSSPPELTLISNIFDIPEAYDAAWWDDTNLLINMGQWETSSVGCFNIMSSSSSLIISDIPGGSGGVVLDKNKNLIVGLGYDPSGIITGQVNMFDHARVLIAIGGGASIDHSAGITLGQFLSAGHMVVDHNNDLFIGGGNFLDGVNPDACGHLEKIILGDTSDLSSYLGPEATETIIIDPCQDDTATGSLCLVKQGGIT